MQKRGDTRLQGGGALDNPVEVYNVSETVGQSYGVKRAVGSLAFKAFAAFGPYLGQELRAALREVGETWAVFTIRYHRSRVPLEGMFVKHLLTGDVYEIRGVEHIAGARISIELTCRMVR